MDGGRFVSGGGTWARTSRGQGRTTHIMIVVQSQSTPIQCTGLRRPDPVLTWPSSASTAAATARWYVIVSRRVEHTSFEGTDRSVPPILTSLDRVGRATRERRALERPVDAPTLGARRGGGRANVVSVTPHTTHKRGPSDCQVAFAQSTYQQYRIPNDRVTLSNGGPDNPPPRFGHSFTATKGTS